MYKYSLATMFKTLYTCTTFDNLHWPQVVILFVRFFIPILKQKGKRQFCRFNLILSLLFYDEQKLIYDQFTTYILVRSVGHFVLAAILKMVEFEVARNC